jgi:hypothetical protein
MDELEGDEEGGRHNEYERVWVKDLEQPLEGYYVYPKSKGAHLPLIPSGGMAASSSSLEACVKDGVFGE